MCDSCVIRLTPMERPPYSGGMISEFNELSDKIGLLAEMTHALRRENAQLRKDNIALSADNAMYVQRSEEHTSELQSHRDLHSFPTRRSSDLQNRLAGRNDPCAAS